jgi:hypothetical protein
VHIVVKCAWSTEAGDVRDVRHQVGAVLVGDLTDAREVDRARVRRRAADDQLRLVLDRQAVGLVVVEPLVLRQAVADRVEDLTRDRGLRAVRQVPARVEVHAEQRVAGLEDREEHDLVGGGGRHRLDVGELRPEQRLGAVDRELLDLVDVPAAGVEARARVALGGDVHRRHRLAGQRRRVGDAGGRHHRQHLVLALVLVHQDPVELGIQLLQALDARASEARQVRFGLDVLHRGVTVVETRRAAGRFRPLLSSSGSSSCWQLLGTGAGTA